MISAFAALSLLALVGFTNAQSFSQIQIKPLIRPSYATPDRYGYRYCPFWKLQDGTNVFSICTPYPFYRCGEYLEIDYKCCTGFAMSKDDMLKKNRQGKAKCSIKLSAHYNVNYLLSTYYSGYSWFTSSTALAQYIGDNAASDNMGYTIFAPLNDWKGQYRLRNIRNAANFELMHVVQGRYYIRDFYDGLRMKSVFKNAELIVNRYSCGMFTVNCVEVMEANLETLNGVVHLIRYPLNSYGSTGTASIFDLVQQEAPYFASAFTSELRNLLSEVGSPARYTVFIPSQEAWNALSPAVKNNPARLEIYVKNHIVAKQHCSASIYRYRRRIYTLAGEYVQSSCAREQSRIEASYRDEVRYLSNMCGLDTHFLTENIMAANGVVHKISGVLAPLSGMLRSEAFQVSSCPAMQTRWLAQTFWQAFFSECNIQFNDADKWAVFVPVQSAFAWFNSYAGFRTESQRYATDKDYRCKTIRYHYGKYNPDINMIVTMWHQRRGYRTQNVELRHSVNYILKDMDTTKLYFHYAQNWNFEAIRFFNGVFYLINRVIVYPELSLYQRLQQREDFSLMWKWTNIHNWGALYFEKYRPLNLYLVSRTESWQLADKNVQRQKITAFGTPKSQQNFLLLHTVPLYLWGGDIGYFKADSLHRFMSRLGLELIFHMTTNGEMYIGHAEFERKNWAKVIEWNIYAYDGIIWVLDRPIFCPKRFCPVLKKGVRMLDMYACACRVKENLNGPGMDAKGANDKETTKMLTKAYTNAAVQISTMNDGSCTWYKHATLSFRQK